jgi:hypothetical protein
MDTRYGCVMTQTEPHARLYIPVVFNYGMRSEVSLAAGSVVEWTPEDGSLIRVWFRGMSKVISMDDATPVEWDDADQMWIEE